MKKSATSLSTVTVLLISLLGPAIAETVYIPEIKTHDGGLITDLYHYLSGDKKSDTWHLYSPELTEQACIESIGRHVGDPRDPSSHWDEVLDWKCEKAFTNVPR
jgi:hypothetical protein